MKHAYTLIPFLVVVISCATQPKQTGPEAILIQMRADTSWIHHLDSLAQTAIGPGAKCLDKEEFTDSILESLEEDGFTVFRRDEKEEVITVFARSAQGINFMGRYLYADEDGIEHCVSVQYPDDKAEEAIPVIAMASHYPLGPMTDSSVFSLHLFEILESFCNLVCSN